MIMQSHTKKLLMISMLFMGMKTDICAKADTYEEEVGGEEEKIEQPRIGNFALPTAQQPSSFISFGQNIVDARDLKLFTYTGYFKGCNQFAAEIIPAALYGIKDNVSIFVGLPIAAKFMENNHVSQGPQDFFIQFEGSLYEKNTADQLLLVTLVANMGAPTGLGIAALPEEESDAEPEVAVPVTGSGAPSFFLGFTASHLGVSWYYFTSMGAAFFLPHLGNKAGDFFLYQFGLGRNIWYSPDKWIFNWLIELDGRYTKRDTLKCQVAPNSGGNEVLLGPSLFFSSQHFTLQFGVSWVVSQHLFGVQNKQDYLIAANLAWLF